MAYGLVPQAIQQTGRTMRDILSHEAAGRVSMARTGLMKERQGYDIREAEYEKYMQAPDTIKNIVNTMNVPEEQKQRFREHSLYKDLQDIPTSRTNFFQALQATMAKKKEWAREDETSQQKYRQGLLGTYTPESVQAFARSISPENTEGDVGLLERPTKHVPYGQTKEGALALANIRAEGKKVTAKDISGFLAGRTVEELSDAEVALLGDLLENYDGDLGVIEEDIPAQRSWWGDIREPNIPATTKKVLRAMPKTGAGQGTQAGLTPPKAGGQPTAQNIYDEFSKIKNEGDQADYLTDLRSGSPEMYEALKKMVREAKQPVKEPSPKKTTEAELRKALYKITGKAEDLYPPSRKPFKKITETAKNIGRGALSLANEPVPREALPHFSQQRLRQGLR